MLCLQLPALPDDDAWDSSLEDGDDGDELGQDSEMCDSCLQVGFPLVSSPSITVIILIR